MCDLVFETAKIDVVQGVYGELWGMSLIKTHSCCSVREPSALIETVDIDARAVRVWLNKRILVLDLPSLHHPKEQLP
jgi:hypothetical protein